MPTETNSPQQKFVKELDCKPSLDQKPTKSKENETPVFGATMIGAGMHLKLNANNEKSRSYLDPYVRNQSRDRHSKRLRLPVREGNFVLKITS